MRSQGRTPFQAGCAAGRLEPDAKGWKTLVQLFRSRAALSGSNKAYVFLKNGEVENEFLDYASLDLQAITEEKAPVFKRKIFACYSNEHPEFDIINQLVSSLSF